MVSNVSRILLKYFWKMWCSRVLHYTHRVKAYYPDSEFLVCLIFGLISEPSGSECSVASGSEARAKRPCMLGLFKSFCSCLREHIFISLDIKVCEPYYYNYYYNYINNINNNARENTGARILERKFKFGV